MNFLWKYFDRRRAATAALQDFKVMEMIIDTTPAAIKERQQPESFLASPNLDGMPRHGNPKALEDRITDRLHQIDILQERYQEARAYMEWFLPAWAALDEDDRFTLEAFYLGNEDQAAQQVADHLNVERSSAYRRKSRAVAKLAAGLYGSG